MITGLIVGLILGFLLAPQSVARERVIKVYGDIKSKSPVIVDPSEDEDAKVDEFFGFEE